MQRFSVDGRKLSVFRRGEGSIILFIHGFPFDHTMYLPLCDRLSVSYCCMAVDLPGFGESEPFPNATAVSIKDYAESINLLLDVMNINEPIVLYGLSMGGYIAMEFARSHENRLSGLILSNTRTGIDSPATIQNRLRLAQSVRQTGMEPVADSMIPNLLSEHTRLHSPKTVEFLRHMMIRQIPEGVAAASSAMASRLDTSDVLRQLNVPVQFIAASDDIPSPALVMNTMFALTKNGSYDEITGSGHLTPLENPERCADIVNNFCRKIPSFSNRFSSYTGSP